MSIETAKFVVQRGANQLQCRGDELKDKLQNRDLMAVQHNNEDQASRFTYLELQDPGTVEEWAYGNVLESLGVVPETWLTSSFAFDICQDEATNTLYYIHNNIVLKSTDGENWTVQATSVPWKNIGTSITDNHNLRLSYIDGKIYARMQRMIYSSSDEGVNWDLEKDMGLDYGNRAGAVGKGYDSFYNVGFLYLFSGARRSGACPIWFKEDGGSWTKININRANMGSVAWHDDSEQFFAIDDAQFNGEVVKFYYKNSGSINPSTVASVPQTTGFPYEHITLANDKLYLKSTSTVGYVLDLDGNEIFTAPITPSTTYQTGDRGDVIRYDAPSGEILIGQNNWNPGAIGASNEYWGRVNVREYDAGNIPEYNDNRRSGPSGHSMVYHPPSKKYYLATAANIFISFEQQPGDADFVVRTVPGPVTNNIDFIQDTDWLCCTDYDGKTYKVHGDKFKGLFGGTAP